MDNIKVKNLQNVSLEDHYKTGQHSLADDFYRPVLANTVKYDRLSGYFRTSVSSLMREEYIDLAKQGGKIRIICSHKLDNADITEIQTGYELKEKISELFHHSIEQTLEEPWGEEAVGIFAALIAHNCLEVKISVLREGDGFVHDKIGLFYDELGNTVSYIGSINETTAGWNSNHESFSVFQSWDNGNKWIHAHASQFENTWKNIDETLITIPFPEISEQLLKDRYPNISLADASNLLNKIRELYPVPDTSQNIAGSINRPSTRDHQKNALIEWHNNHYQGIYEHCTGSGKTFTALLSIDEWTKSRDRSSVLIVVPSTLLLKQWKEQLESFFYHKEHKYILAIGGGYGSAEPQYIHAGTTPSAGMLKITITTIQTASQASFIEAVSNDPNLLLVVDEVHWAGAETFQNLLHIKAGGRLGLSATPERHMDPEGTNKIMSYFGGVIHKYEMSNAIKDGHLTPYMYHPKAIELTDSETEKWNKLTQDLGPFLNSNGSERPSGAAKNILIARASVVKQAKNKIPLAANILASVKNNERWIVYCDDSSQLEKLKNILNDSGKHVLEYYSNQKGDQNANLEEFKKFGGIILSCKMLDEGIDIPAADHALILASSQNKREYIQRRGRVLRVSHETGKTQSTIYDALVLPLSSGTAEDQYSIIKNELSRAYQFSLDSENGGDVQLQLLEYAKRLQIQDIDAVLDTDEESTDPETDPEE